MNKEIYAHKRITYNKFVTFLMSNGNRSAAEHIMRGCVARIKVKEEKDSLSLFACSARRAKPLIVGVQNPILRKKKIVPIPSNRGRRLAIQ
jgi:ribosomal protein S7